ncbi:MAG: hypothetical protein CBC42_07120 [Betaproteobacteria bacterium TMED82]|jgi:outer membrane protein assembly factor BamE|nr:MAG: hypothetical protein CBC42_07120 [Betaproteobacteria bacterium TMED82]|tara:strand:+ start:28546 stop:28974 length:429 start_codon:yes stop_codon:yes gene_type:complete
MLRFVLYFCVVFITGCSGNLLSKFQETTQSNIWENFTEKLPRAIKPYRIDIVQGNYITRDMVKKLEKGHSKNRVVEVLGTPLINDPFRENRWDYVFYVFRGNGEKESRVFTVEFVNDSLSNWDGDPIDEDVGQYLLPSRTLR